jgi:D-alanyl-D-alanine carboxypeptidase/D-alanyl-D-alanine-endopeptidase (penicillin-binding protein 4)
MKSIFRKKNGILCFAFFCFLCAGNPENLHAEKWDDLQKFIGNRDAVLIADPEGNILFSENADEKLIPASTLKILTSLTAIHHLGNDFRFVTEFYTDSRSNLKIKGYGDPLLISEAVAEICKTLATKISSFNDLILDHSYFDPIDIPGVTSTLNPYDAPNGALCVNFNTVSFKRENGGYISAEPQTPLLPFALKKIVKYGRNSERVIFSQEQDEITLYAGHLFQYFMQKEGIASKGNIRIGKVDEDRDPLVYRYVSRFSMEEVISKLLEYSNNFIANQTLVAAGAQIYGPPGALEKGIRAASAYLDILNAEDIKIVEGSGISRENRISAQSLCRLLKAFEPYRHLMRHEGRQFYKTGSLTGVKTRAGYIEKGKGEFYRFVVMINSSGKTTDAIMSKILRKLP